VRVVRSWWLQIVWEWFVPEFEVIEECGDAGVAFVE
jgi:hypothetical protein